MKTLRAATAAVFVLLATDAGAQCAMCRSVLESPEAGPLAAALRSGILVLIAAPFACFATVAVLALRSQKRPPRDGASLASLESLESHAQPQMKRT